MRSLIIGIVLVIFSIPAQTHAFSATGISFGGTVTAITYCNTGILAYLKTTKGPLPVMWFWGELPFSSYIPPHPGQQLKGKFAPITAPCFVGYYPVGYGFPITFHGANL